MSFPRIDVERIQRDAQDALDELRANTRKHARIDIDVEHPFDLRESRVFVLNDDGELEVNARLHVDDYSDLIAWRSSAKMDVDLKLLLIGFSVGALAATLIALIVR